MQKVWENENLICYEENKLQYLQFKKLLEYPELTHCYTLRNENKLDFPPIYKDEIKYKESCKAICECLNKNNEERFKSKQTDGNIKQLHKLEPNQIVKPHQTHTDNVEIVDKIKELNEVDGMITNKPNITLLTTSADCTSLLLYDKVQKVIGAVHSGWKGTLQAIGKKAVEKMIQAYGSNPLDMICCICPCIRKCCFEVEEDVKNLFENEYHNLENINEMIQIGNMVQGKQKYYIDTTAINKQLLKSIGLKEENIIDSGICTMCHPEYFHSYRVERENSGRNAAIISLLDFKIF